MKLFRLLPVGIALLLTSALLVLGAQIARAGGTVTTCNEANLTGALAGGGLVQFNCGAATLSVSALKVITSDTTIDGLNAGNLLTLTAASGNGLFQVSPGATLTLTHLTVAGTNYANGAIFVQTGGALVVSNSLLVTNSNIAILSYGPALITNSIVRDNAGGPAIRAAVAGSFDISSSQFISNDNGALKNTGTGPVVIRSSQFSGNGKVPFIVGAVDIANNGFAVGALTVTASSFYNNVGAGINVAAGRAYISDTLVYSNGSSYAGLEFDYPDQTQILSSTIRANLGGGIHVNGGGPGFLVADSQIISNSSPNSVGGILAGTTVFTLSHSIISGNTTVFNNNAGGLSTGAAAFITDSLIAGNSGPQAGGMYMGNAGVPAFVDVIMHSRVLSNTATSYAGGGARIATAALVVDSEFSGNAAITPFTYGGGLVIDSPGNAVTVTHSLFFNNIVSGTNGTGGGLYVAADARIINSTIYSNTAERNGGVHVQLTAALTNVTMVSNTAYGSPLGANLRNAGQPGAVSLFNTIIASGSPTNCGGNTILSLGHNLGSDASCMLTGTADFSGTAALLGPLQDNGGPTFTLMPAPLSPAVNNGSNIGCPADDQRHVARPQQGTCDIGAVESPYAVLKLFLPVIMR